MFMILPVSSFRRLKFHVWNVFFPWWWGWTFNSWYPRNNTAGKAYVAPKWIILALENALYDSYIAEFSLNKRNFLNIKLPWGSGEEWRGGTQRIFKAVKIFKLYVTAVVDTCYTYVQTHRVFNTKMMMCQRRFIDCNKCTILVGTLVHNGRGCACLGAVHVYGKSLNFPLNFAVNLKTLSKKKVLKKILRTS